MSSQHVGATAAPSDERNPFIWGFGSLQGGPGVTTLSARSHSGVRLASARATKSWKTGTFSAGTSMRPPLTILPFDGDAKQTVDSAKTRHRTGTALVGQGGNSVLFGHRTDASDPYRNQHLVQGGDELIINTANQRR